MVPGWASPQVPHALLMPLERCMVSLTFEAEAQMLRDTAGGAVSPGVVAACWSALSCHT